MQLAKRQLAVAVASALFQPTFVWDLSKGSIVPARGATWANVTHTRATVGTFDDQDSMVRTALSGEARFRGLRRVRNLVLGEDFSNGAQWSLSAGVTVTGGQSDPIGGTSAYKVVTPGGVVKGVFRTGFSAVGAVVTSSIWVRADSPITLSLVSANGSGPSVAINVTTAWKRFVVTGTVTIAADGPYINDQAVASTFYIWRAQWEEVNGQAVQTPGEYVSVGVLAAPYHGANVDGVKYFPTHNGNVVQQNMHQQSNSFDQAWWSKTNCTVQANASTDPFGGNNAWGIVQTSANAQVISNSVLAAPFTQVCASIYAKRGNRDWVEMALFDGVTDGVRKWFNLAAGVIGSTGVIGTVFGNVVATMTDMGGGWFRCSLSAQTRNGTGVQHYTYPADTDGLPSSLSAGIGTYIYGAQIQPGRRAGTYVATTAAAVNNNIVEESIGDTVSGNPGYFREDGRTNLFLRSDNFSATWVLTDTTNNPDVAISPDGSTNADRLDEGVAGTSQTAQTVTATANANYAVSIWFKRSNIQWLRLFIANGANSVTKYFDIQNGVVGTTVVAGTGAFVGADITAYPNGWYRIRFAGSVGSAATAISFGFASATADNNATRVNNASYFAWGAQFEDTFSWPSSYMPTTIATVTRNLDVLMCSGLGGYFTADGSWYAESVADQTGISNPRVIGITTSKSPLAHNSGVTPAGPGAYGATIWDASVATSTVNTVNTGSAIAKMCSKYTIGANAAKICLNGGALVAGNTNAFAGENTIGVGVFNNGTGTGFYGVVRKVHAWPRQIPDAYMQRITT